MTQAEVPAADADGRLLWPFPAKGTCAVLSPPVPDTGALELLVSVTGGPVQFLLLPQEPPPAEAAPEESDSCDGGSSSDSDWETPGPTVAQPRPPPPRTDIPLLAAAVAVAKCRLGRAALGTEAACDSVASDETAGEAAAAEAAQQSRLEAEWRETLLDPWSAAGSPEARRYDPAFTSALRTAARQVADATSASLVAATNLRRAAEELLAAVAGTDPVAQLLAPPAVEPTAVAPSLDDAAAAASSSPAASPATSASPSRASLRSPAAALGTVVAAMAQRSFAAAARVVRPVAGGPSEGPMAPAALAAAGLPSPVWRGNPDAWASERLVVRAFLRRQCDDQVFRDAAARVAPCQVWYDALYAAEKQSASAVADLERAVAAIRKTAGQPVAASEVRPQAAAKLFAKRPWGAAGPVTAAPVQFGMVRVVVDPTMAQAVLAPAHCDVLWGRIGLPHVPWRPHDPPETRHAVAVVAQATSDSPTTVAVVRCRRVPPGTTAYYGLDDGLPAAT